MSKNPNKAWFSRIDYRPNPIDPVKDVVNLGFLLEFTTSEYWAVATLIVAALDDSALVAADKLSRELLEHRKEVIENEVRRVLPRARKPGEVLRLLAGSNPWSIHISAPGVLEQLPASATRDASVEKVAEKYAVCLFTTSVSARGKRRKQTVRRKETVQPAITTPVPVVPVDVPPPWILPPTCLIRLHRTHD
jgi:hypothetical protein